MAKPQPQEAEAPAKTYTGWQQRVIEEKSELDAKITKLREFIGTKEHDKLDATQRTLLMRQMHTMTAYSVVLGQRIDLF